MMTRWQKSAGICHVHPGILHRDEGDSFVSLSVMTTSARKNSFQVTMNCQMATKMRAGLTKGRAT